MMNNSNVNKRNLMIIHNRDGSEEEVEVILAFRFNDTGREFIIYTKNEIDKDGDEFIYVSEKFYGPDNGVELQDISDDDLPRIENLLRRIAEIEDDESSNKISPDSDGIEIIGEDCAKTQCKCEETVTADQWIYDVAISFAGEQSDYAFKLATTVKTMNLNVFCDCLKIEELYESDIQKTFEKNMSLSRYVIILFSEEYSTGYWARPEFGSLRTRVETEDDSVLGITTDGSVPDGWPIGNVYISSSAFTTDEIADMIKSKVIAQKSRENDPFRITAMPSYDIALSFAGEQRGYVSDLARKMRALNLKVFYSPWENASLWGTDLKKQLTERYIESSKFVVAVFSKEYIKKFWTKFEFEHLRKRLEGDESSVLGIATDGIIPDDWPTNRECVHASDYSTEEIATMMKSKLDAFRKRKELKKNTMILNNSDGSTEEVEVLLAFRFNDTGREYVVYTKNEIDEKGNITIYTSEVIHNSETEVELKCVSEDEWIRVKTVIRQNCTDYEDVFDGLLLDSEGFEFI